MKRILLPFLVLIAISGCSSSRPKPTVDAPAPHAALSGHSEIHITYTLGHGHRRFVAMADDSKVRGQTFVDRTLLKENSIEPSKYHAFFQRVAEVVEKGRTPAQATAPAEAEECRMPYTITVVQGQETKKLSGCRNGDEGTVGKIIRDGEFLLFGRN